MYVGSIGPIIPVQSLCWPWMTNPMVKGKLFSVYAFAIKLRNSASSFHWLSSSIFNVRSFGCPASVTPPLISTVWCFRPYKLYIFCEDMILATCQLSVSTYPLYSLLSWAQFTVVLFFQLSLIPTSTVFNMIDQCNVRASQPTTNKRTIPNLS